jgi:MFS family permease
LSNQPPNPITTTLIRIREIVSPLLPELAAPGRLLRSDWRKTFTAFNHPDYRLYFGGLLLSAIGTWSQTIAQGWLVYDMTHSPLALGQVTFASAIPIWLFAPWAGVIIDRTSRRMLLVITQTVMMLQAFALAALTFSGHIEVWHIMALSVVMGIANAFDAPTRQSFLIELVGKEDMPNAIALNSTMFSLARTLGPAIGGIVLAWFGTAWAFNINGISFLAILISLMLIKIQPRTIRPSTQSPLQDLWEGLRFIGQNQAVWGLLLISFLVSLFGSAFSTLLPVITRDILHRNEIAFGFLNAASGLGSVVGALLVAYFSIRSHRGRLLSALNIFLPITLILLALSRSYEFSLIALMAVGLSYVPQLSTCNLLIQSIIPDAMRGRVMSVFSLMIFGMFPVGGLLAGALADALDAPLAIGINAGVMLIGLMGVRLVAPAVARLD